MSTGTAVLDSTLTLNGLNFHYREWPRAGANALLLLHGLSSHAHSWDRFAEAMSDRYRVLALDQRGHGETQWTTEYTRDRLVEDLEAFVAALGLERFTLLGLSMGGICAFGYASQHPETLERLVIVDIAPELEEAGRTRIATGLAAPANFADPEEAIAAARVANPRADEDSLRQRVLHNLRQPPGGQWTFRWDPALGELPRAPAPDPETVWASLRKITCPTLVIRGEESDILGRGSAERLKREIADCRVVEVEGAGHSVPLDRPEGFLAAARPFLTG